MDSCDDDPFHLSPLSSSTSTSTKEDDEKVVENNNVEDLLEEAWFFGKVLSSTKPSKMSRCYSDPSPNFGQRLLPENPSSILTTCSSKNLAAGNLRVEIVEEKETSKISQLNRQLSDLSLVKKESRFPRQKVIIGRPSKHKLLLRTPSLPSPSIIAREVAEEEDDDDDDDSDITMSKLIREAMPLSSQVLPPRSHSSKGMTQSSSLQKNRSARNLKGLGYLNQRNLKERTTVIESQELEVQGYKNNLGFTFNQKQEKTGEDNKVKRPYLSEAWYAKSCAPPPIPIWAKKNSAEDMKMQLKYWARAVASKAR